MAILLNSTKTRVPKSMETLAQRRIKKAVAKSYIRFEFQVVDMQMNVLGLQGGQLKKV